MRVPEGGMPAAVSKDKLPATAGASIFLAWILLESPSDDFLPTSHLLGLANSWSQCNQAPFFGTFCFSH